MSQNKLRIKGVNTGGGIISNPIITFTKADYGTDVDVVSPYLTLKRGNNQGLFNTNEGASYTLTFEGGKNHLWASEPLFELIEGNPSYWYSNIWSTFNTTSINISELQSIVNGGDNAIDWTVLPMVPWGKSVNGNPPLMVGKEMIMLDVLDQKFYKIKFTSWTAGGAGGGLSYTRQLIN